MTYIGRTIDEPEQLKRVTAGDEIRFYEATGL